MEVPHASAGSASARLAELADVADACRVAFLAVAAESHWRESRPSAAAATRAVVAEKEASTNSDGILAGFDLVTEVIVTYLEVAAGHLGGLAALYRSGEVMFPPLPLVRAVIENSAHAMWVIGDGEGKPEDLLARAYLEEFTSCEFAKMAAGRMGSKEDDVYKAAQRRWRTVQRRALAAFPGATADDLAESGGGRRLGGQLLPGPEAGATWMFGLLERLAGSTLTERQGEGIYAFLSSGTHPSVYQARQLRVAVDHGDHQGTTLIVEVGFLERLLSAAVSAFYNALSYVMSFYGMSTGPHDTLTAKIDMVLPGLLT